MHTVFTISETPIRIWVQGLPQDYSIEDIKLFFESKTYCPLGGNVDDVQLESDGSAAVTFEKASGRFKIFNHAVYILISSLDDKLQVTAADKCLSIRYLMQFF